MRRIAPPLLPLLIGGALQLSGYQNAVVAIILLAAAFLLAGFSALSWLHDRRQPVEPPGTPTRPITWGDLASIRVPVDPHAEREPSDFERWAAERLSAAEELKRQRRVLGDSWFCKRVRDWESRTAWDLLEKHSVGLSNRYSAGDLGDGIEPPHSAAEYGAFLDRRMAVLNGWLRDLKKDA